MSESKKISEITIAHIGIALWINCFYSAVSIEVIAIFTGGFFVIISLYFKESFKYFYALVVFGVYAFIGLISVFNDSGTRWNGEVFMVTTWLIAPLGSHFIIQGLTSNKWLIPLGLVLLAPFILLMISYFT